MKLFSIEYINNTYFSYEDPKYRSIKKFMKRNRIRIIKLGKKSYVKQIDFEDVLNKITGDKKITKSPLLKMESSIENPKLPDNEQKLYRDLLDKITEL